MKVEVLPEKQDRFSFVYDPAGRDPEQAPGPTDPLAAAMAEVYSHLTEKESVLKSEEKKAS